MKNWYVVNVYAGFESKFVETLKSRISENSMNESFGEILIPATKKIQVRKGEKVEVDERHFPGYVLIEMEMNDEAWHLVLSVPKVTGFLGSKGKPLSISKKELESIKKAKSEDNTVEGDAAHNFIVGQEVKLCDGPFASFSGVIENVDHEKARLKVSVSIFGRLTPVDIGFDQVEVIT